MVVLVVVLVLVVVVVAVVVVVVVAVAVAVAVGVAVVVVVVVVVVVIVHVARHDKAVRRSILHWCRTAVVLPQARAKDERECQMAAQKLLAGFRLSVQQVFPCRGCVAWQHAPVDLSPFDWENLRLWAVARLTACWPCQLGGTDSPKDVLDECPWRSGGGCGPLPARMAQAPCQSFIHQVQLG